MKRKVLTTSFVFLFFLILSLIIFNLLQKQKVTPELSKENSTESQYNSNIINNVSYVTRDLKGNEYRINARIGEIDLSDSDIIYLTDVNGLITLTNLNTIIINSKFGKYNISNNDTIFSKNVVIDYLENNVTGDYLDFSLIRNSMIISKNVVYTNLENILKADVVEIDIKTKDTKIFMHNSNDKVNIQSID